MKNWKKVENKMPKIENKHGDSIDVLCKEEMWETPFVGYYNEQAKEWRVSHWAARSQAVTVNYWKEIK